MIRSMTGYSSGRTDEGGFSLSISVKATNHRFLDLQVRISPGLESLEPALRRVVKDYVARGHVELDRKSTRLNSSHIQKSRMPSSA